MRLSETMPTTARARSGRTYGQAYSQAYSQTYGRPEHERPSAPNGGGDGRGKRPVGKLLGSLIGITLVVGTLSASVYVATQRFAAHAEQVNQNCALIAPAQPLTAQGLATPYQLTAQDGDNGPCHEANAAQAAFVQGVILDPATGKVSIYNPLVVDKGKAPAVAPTVPTLPTGAVVALWFGFNGATLRLRDAHNGALAAANCVNGQGDSLFGQVAYCNAPQFFQTANQLIQAGTLTVPALGTARDGLPCPTVRDFAVVDQDQSDNVTTTYLTTEDGKTAQDTAANAAALATTGAKVAKNASDNGLLSVAMDGALGCSPWTAPDLANGGALAPAQPLNELQAAMYQAAPAATVPSADPMVLRDGDPSLTKQNLYRAGVDQAPVASAEQARADTLAYCRNLYTVAPARLLRDRPFFIGQPSPVPAAANNLFTFLAQRFAFTFSDQGLGCVTLLHVANPVKAHTNDEGVTVAATISTRSTDSMDSDQGRKQS